MLVKTAMPSKRRHSLHLIFQFSRGICKDESGSASIEFVLLAIPLFLSIFIFLGHFENLSHSELIAQTIVRESLRAYVTSENSWSAPSRADQVLKSAAKAEGLTDSEIQSLDLSFQCSEFPCLKPGGKVHATLKLALNNQKRLVIAEAEEYISPWQWSGLYPNLFDQTKSLSDVQM